MFVQKSGNLPITCLSHPFSVVSVETRHCLHGPKAVRLHFTRFTLSFLITWRSVPTYLKSEKHSPAVHAVFGLIIFYSISHFVQLFDAKRAPCYFDMETKGCPFASVAK